VLVDRCAPALLEPPVNVLRLSLHPDGMAPRIRNLPQWRAHLLTQLSHRAQALGDQRLRDLHTELLGYPRRDGRGGAGGPAWCCPCTTRRASGSCRCSAISAVVGTATDVTVEELAVEAFYPADAATAEFLRSIRPDPA